ncbi:unnamed protein product, partial [Laminaria digitata]
LFIFQFPNLASAQAGNCEPAQAEAILDAGNVRANIYNNGGLFWNGGGYGYEVPKGSDKHSIFAAGIWIAGLVDGELKGSAARYSRWEFWPGPLDNDGNPPDDCSSFDKIWEIKREDLQAYIDSGNISGNLRNWPWQLGAPVVDGDGNLHNYNLQEGDLPELFGDQRLWWIMNDRGNTHESTNGESIGLEVQASAHAYDYSGFIGNVTFYDYQIINKNNQDLTDAYFAFFKDSDLGSFDDDYVGSDSLLHLGYTYNGDNDDEGGYGEAPPAIGITFLKTAIASIDGRDNDRDGVIDEPEEMIGATGFMFYYKGGSVIGVPQSLQDYYYYMQSRWKDGVPVTIGGFGRDFSTIRAPFAFPGDPVIGSGWTERTPDQSTTIVPNIPADRRSFTASGPFSIVSGDTLNIRFAIVWSRGTDHLDSVTELKKDVATRQCAPEAYYQHPVIVPQRIPPPAFNLGFDQNFPNPFDISTVLRYSLPQTMQVRLAVYDMLGREVEVLVEQQQEAGIYTVDFEAGTLPSGIYMARIE